MSWWEVHDVTTWATTYDEPRGKRAKVWVASPDGRAWLRKLPLDKPPRPYEPAVEALTLEIAHRCGFEVARGRAAQWKDDAGIAMRGFVSPRFHDGASEEQLTGGILVEGALGMSRATSSEEQAKRPLVTLQLVRSVLDEQQQRYGVDLLGPFLAMLLFDAWIGNGDRHADNWALLRRGPPASAPACRLAPMYDTASCLGVELLDAQVEEHLESRQRRDRYIGRCRSGFGDGAHNPTILQTALLTELRSWPEWDGVASITIPRLCASVSTAMSIVHEVPDEWLPARRRELACALLEARATLLEGVT